MMENRASLTNEELNKATGGYREDDLARHTFGKEVGCPNCHSYLAQDFEYLGENDLAGDYRCKCCGTIFKV